MFEIFAIVWVVDGAWGISSYIRTIKGDIGVNIKSSNSSRKGPLIYVFFRSVNVDFIEKKIEAILHVVRVIERNFSNKRAVICSNSCNAIKTIISG